MLLIRCADCAYGIAGDIAPAACPRCAGLLELELVAPLPSASDLRALFAARHSPDSRSTIPDPRSPIPDRSGVWRYRELVLDGADRDAVTFPEGNTPLLDRGPVSQWVGVDRLLIKHEGLNPTGSFKDRGMTVAITAARRAGARAVACASTGNTSSSMAAYASIAGIPAVVLVPAGQVSPAKVAQTAAYGARILAVRGDFDACMRMVRDVAASVGLYLVNSVNPYRLAGQRTIVFEMMEQLGWVAPDWISLPAGNLGNASAFGAALRDLRTLGLIDRLPRLLLVQAEGAAPFAASFRDNFATRIRVTPETVASAIRIGDPVSFDRAARAIRDTHGAVVAVPDAELLEAKWTLDRAGVGCEPASAAAVAGVRRLAASGSIAPTDSVVAVLTGHLLKDVDAGGSLRAAGAIEIDATEDDLRRALSRTETR